MKNKAQAKALIVLLIIAIIFIVGIAIFMIARFSGLFIISGFPGGAPPYQASTRLIEDAFNFHTIDFLINADNSNCGGIDTCVSDQGDTFDFTFSFKQDSARVPDGQSEDNYLKSNTYPIESKDIISGDWVEVEIPVLNIVQILPQGSQGFRTPSEVIATPDELIARCRPQYLNIQSQIRVGAECEGSGKIICKSERGCKWKYDNARFRFMANPKDFVPGDEEILDTIEDITGEIDDEESEDSSSNEEDNTPELNTECVDNVNCIEICGDEIPTCIDNRCLCEDDKGEITNPSNQNDPEYPSKGLWEKFKNWWSNLFKNWKLI